MTLQVNTASYEAIFNLREITYVHLLTELKYTTRSFVHAFLISRLPNSVIKEKYNSTASLIHKSAPKTSHGENRTHRCQVP